jgi:putative ABC transport system permease protein
MRHALRNLVRAPGLAVTVVGTLTVALAFTMATAGVVDGLLFRPYQYPNLGRLLLIRDSRPREGAHQSHAIAIADLLDARERVSAFSAVTAWRAQAVVVTNAAADPEAIEGASATANFFSTLGVTALVGRTFEADADTAGHDRVVVLTRRLWQSRFGGLPLVGREIGLNGRNATVIGIIRDEDAYPSGVDAWTPLVFTPADRTERQAQRVAAIGRLADGSTTAAAASQLTALAGALAVQFPVTNTGRGFDLLPLQREQYEFTASLFLFVAAAALLVLLLAFVNVSSLLVVRTLDRRREIVTRVMLGATTRQAAAVARTEVTALAMTATGCAALLAPGALAAIRASLPEGIARWIAGWTSMRIGAGALAVGGAIGLLIAGAIAALVTLAGTRITQGLANTARASARASWGRRLVVTGEVGLAASLLLATAVTVAGFNRIAAAYDALAPSRLLRFTLTLPETRYPDAARIAAFHARLVDALRGLPEVEGVALIRNEPASNVPNPIAAFQREDLAPVQPGETPRIDVEVVSPAAFETLHLEVASGRALADEDGPEAPRVAVISRTAAHRYWPDRDPIGTRIRFERETQPVRIVGVVSDFALNWYDPNARPIVFLADAQSPARTTSVIVRTRRDPLSLARPIRAAVARLDDRQPLSGVEPLSASIADSLSPVRIIERMLIVGAALAAALAALGIYAMLSHAVSARRREFGVRYALGATRAIIGRLVWREALTTGAAGIVAGVLVTAVAIRAARSALLGVPSLDARAVVAVAIAAIAVTLAGAFGPVRRAANVDVAVLLRME